MGRIKKNVKVAMRAIVEWGFLHIVDDDLNWSEGAEENTLLGFTYEEFIEAHGRLLKKLPKEEYEE